MLLTFLPLYLVISLIPIVFIACALWSKRQQVRSHTQPSKAQELLPASGRRRRSVRRPWYRLHWARALIQGTRDAAGTTNTTVRFEDENNESGDGIELQSFSANTRNAEDASSPDIIVHAEAAVLTKPLPGKAIPRISLGPAIETWTATEDPTENQTEEILKKQQKQHKHTREFDNNNVNTNITESDNPELSSPASMLRRDWWNLPDEEDNNDDGNANGRDNNERQSDPVPWFRLGLRADVPVPGKSSVFLLEPRRKSAVVAVAGTGGQGGSGTATRAEESQPHCGSGSARSGDNSGDACLWKST